MLPEIMAMDLPTIHFVSRGKSGDGNRVNEDFIRAKGYPVVFNHLPNTLRVSTLPPKDHLVVSYSTITSAIHLAAYMGAKNIILVGHDSGTLDGECNFDGYHTDASYKIVWPRGKEDYIRWLCQARGYTFVDE